MKAVETGGVDVERAPAPACAIRISGWMATTLTALLIIHAVLYVYRMTALRTVALFGLACLGTVLAQGPAPCCPATPHTISVQGEGSVKRSPDLVTVTLSIVSNGTTARAASSSNAATTAAVTAYLRTLEIAEGSISLQAMSLQEKREWVDTGNGRPGKWINQGYEATRTLTIELTDSTGNAEFPALASVLEGSVEAGANRVDGVQYGLVDPGSARAAALEVATRDAMRKATSITSGLGSSYSLGAVASVSESGGFYPSPAMSRAQAPMAMAEADFKTADVAPAGDLTITASISLVVELVRSA